jgi:hypothetical protein
MYVWPSQIFSALLLGTHHLNTSLVWAPCFGNALHKEPAKNCEFLESLYKGPFSVNVIDSPVVCQSLREGCHQWSSFPTQLNCLFPSSSCSVQTGQRVANKGYIASRVLWILLQLRTSSCSPHKTTSETQVKERQILALLFAKSVQIIKVCTMRSRV